MVKRGAKDFVAGYDNCPSAANLAVVMMDARMTSRERGEVFM